MSTAERTLTKPAPSKPRITEPDVDIRICLGTGGVAAGSREVLAAFEEKLAGTGVLAVIRPREDDCANGRCASITGRSPGACGGGPRRPCGGSRWPRRTSACATTRTR